MSGISLRLLGEVSAVVDGDLRRLPGQRQRAVLAYLSLRASRTVGWDQLSDALWGERHPKTARNSIQRFVSDIRRALGPHADRLETVPDGYRLLAAPEEIDVHRARSTIAEGRAAMSAGDPGEAVQQFGRALALWRGRALGGLGDADFATGEISQLEEVRLSTVEDVIEAELALGRHREIAGTVESFAHENRTRERAWLLLMLARYRCDRQADAVAAYHELREHLEKELGIEPSPAVEELHLQILEQVPEVDPPAVSAGEADLVEWSLEAPFAIPLPSPLERSSHFPMSGRSAEVATLAAARDAVVAGGPRPRVLLVAGEAGIGKTRLASEVGSLFHREGVSVLYGRCEEDLSTPYQPWVDVFEHLVRHAPERFVQRHAEQFADP
ncbi:MAG: BTAD domain-containing putative transcriptional regulator, partial [Planctomycetota bacterium]